MLKEGLLIDTTTHLSFRRTIFKQVFTAHGFNKISSFSRKDFVLYTLAATCLSTVCMSVFISTEHIVFPLGAKYTQ
jgi:hypothetical protein